MIYPTFHYNEPQNILAIELIDAISGEECFVFEVTEINEDPDALIAVSYTHLTLPTKRIV